MIPQLSRPQPCHYTPAAVLVAAHTIYQKYKKISKKFTCMLKHFGIYIPCLVVLKMYAIFQTNA